MIQIPNSNFQFPNNNQFLNSKFQSLFFGFCDLDFTDEGGLYG